MLANGDAHLKNWSLLYEDQVTPMLFPAYDIVTINVYIENGSEFALNLGAKLNKTKKWLIVSYAHFENWANKSGIPWRAIKPHLDDTMEKSRSLWPEALKNLPMDELHKESLENHWKNLQADFRIESKE